MVDSSSPGFQPITARGAVTERGLDRLLSLAYQASFNTDEGRSTRARLFVPDVGRPAAPLRINHRFTPPKQVSDPKMISQLATALVADDSALVVQETGSGLACVGIGMLDAQDAARPLLGMPRGWTGAAGGLQVQVLAPGELRVSEGPAEYTSSALTASWSIAGWRPWPRSITGSRNLGTRDLMGAMFGRERGLERAALHRPRRRREGPLVTRTEGGGPLAARGGTQRIVPAPRPRPSN